MFKYNMCYIHIRDFDKEQKRVISPRYLKSYYGIDGAFDKLKNYINDFDFISLNEAIHSTKMDTLKKMEL